MNIICITRNYSNIQTRVSTRVQINYCTPKSTKPHYPIVLKEDKKQQKNL